MATPYIVSAERARDVNVFKTPFTSDPTGITAQQNNPLQPRNVAAITDRNPVPPRVIRVNLPRADVLEVTANTISWNLDLSSLRLRPGSYVFFDGYNCSLNMKADITWSLTGLPIHVYNKSGTQADLEFAVVLQGENLNTVSYAVVGSDGRVGAQLASTELQHVTITFSALDNTDQGTFEFGSAFFRFYLTFVEPGAFVL
jgi:hypothetical protein